MNIENFKPFDGQHCETTTTGTLLRQIGIELSEPMLFGLGEGLGFIFWKMKSMEFPFIGGRVKPDVLTKNIARNLNLDLTVRETSSPQKAWKEVKQILDLGQAVGLKLDCFHLEYFSNPFHFAGHYAAIYGYDEEKAFLVDTRQQGGRVTASLDSLARARAAKGPMASKNLFYTLQRSGQNFDLEKAVLTAIKNNANEYLNPPITNIGYKGILKASKEIVNWFNSSKHIEMEFATAAMLMEEAGTGGALFRNFYRDFLKEAYELLRIPELKMAHDTFVEIAGMWNFVSELFELVSQTKNPVHIEQASDLLKVISASERSTMHFLNAVIGS